MIAQGFSTPQMATACGVSQRQLRYWAENGALPDWVVSSVGRGSGYRFVWHVDAVPLVRLLAVVTGWANSDPGVWGNVGGALPAPRLRQIIDYFALGRIELGSGVALTWDPEAFSESSLSDGGGA